MASRQPEGGKRTKDVKLPSTSEREKIRSRRVSKPEAVRFQTATEGIRSHFQSFEQLLERMQSIQAQLISSEDERISFVFNQGEYEVEGRMSREDALQHVKRLGTMAQGMFEELTGESIPEEVRIAAQNLFTKSTSEGSREDNTNSTELFHAYDNAEWDVELDPTKPPRRIP